jgi:hypothetical protein
MKARQTKPTIKLSTNDVKPQPPAAQESRPHSITVTDDPNDPGALRRDVKDFFLSNVGANVFAGQMRPFVNYTGDFADQTAKKCAESSSPPSWNP